MAETTGIAWTDATMNFWEGCTKVGPGCDHCYAEARDLRYHAGSHWGSGAPRRRMVDATFRRPLAWNAKRAFYEKFLASRLPLDAPWASPIPPLWVFSLSLGDFFDNEIPPTWRDDAWAIIRQCTSLRWQIVTKRSSNVAKMLPGDWGDGSAYAHVGIIATAVTQAEVNREIPRLRELRNCFGVRWTGLSIEPQIEWIDLAPHFSGVARPPIEWVICGGESRQGSGHVPRPFDLDWPRDMLARCQEAGVPFFMKQMGDNPIDRSAGVDPGWRYGSPAGADPSEWPEDLRVRQMPRVYDRAA